MKYYNYVYSWYQLTYNGQVNPNCIVKYFICLQFYYNFYLLELKPLNIIVKKYHYSFKQIDIPTKYVC